VKRKLLFTLFIFFSFLTSLAADYSHIKVLEVIDGDTVRLENGNLLRYIGLDTPEVRIKKGEEFIFSPQPFSQEATEFNRKLVEGKFVRVEFDVEKKDQYGRLLGYCFVGDVFVNAKLLEEGYAVLYTRPPNIKYADLFVRLQSLAREAKKGLWGSYETIDQSKAYKFIGQIRTVRGRVLNTGKSAKCIFLNFGENWKSDFTVAIFNNSLSAFYKKGIDPLTFYQGRIVEATGRIREYNGPEIVINNPDELTLIDEK
jgi:micrococcal nuclease